MVSPRTGRRVNVYSGNEDPFRSSIKEAPANSFYRTILCSETKGPSAVHRIQNVGTCGLFVACPDLARLLK
jgi:hypothetical protein